jgi:homoaconitase
MEMVRNLQASLLVKHLLTTKSLDYAKIDACDEVTTVGLYDLLKSGGQGEVSLIVKKKNTREEITIKTKHTLSEDQCGFILAGSALNLLAKMKRD